jgi:hypothetical protein
MNSPFCRSSHDCAPISEVFQSAAADPATARRKDAVLKMLDELDDGALIAVGPYVLDTGETLRWIVQINGVDAPELDVRVRERPWDPDVVEVFLVEGEEELGSSPGRRSATRMARVCHADAGRHSPRSRLAVGLEFVQELAVLGFV